MASFQVLAAVLIKKNSHDIVDVATSSQYLRDTKPQHIVVLTPIASQDDTVGNVSALSKAALLFANMSRSRPDYKGLTSLSTGSSCHLLQTLLALLLSALQVSSLNHVQIMQNSWGYSSRSPT